MLLCNIFLTIYPSVTDCLVPYFLINVFKLFAYLVLKELALICHLSNTDCKSFTSLFINYQLNKECYLYSFYIYKDILFNAQNQNLLHRNTITADSFSYNFP
uniref:Uncharacterized protein n=1 Tax=Octopus bimaculoides TaxID=37653 RepID=A0A0L8FV78_OCTBM